MNDSMMTFSKATASIKVDGKTYKLAPLTIGDRCQAQRRIQDDRISHLLTGVRAAGLALKDLPLPMEVLGTALAKIECTPVTVGELYDGFDNMQYMLYLSLHRADQSVTTDFVKGITLSVQRVLTEVVLHISSVPLADDTNGQASDPTTCSSTPTTNPVAVGESN